VRFGRRPRCRIGSGGSGRTPSSGLRARAGFALCGGPDLRVGPAFGECSAQSFNRFGRHGDLAHARSFEPTQFLGKGSE